jgi:mevalonate kinase
MGRASSKVILLGEHAVVYGCPAIAAGLDRGAVARAERAAEFSLELAGPGLSAPDPTRAAEMSNALAALARELEVGPCRVHVTLEVPAGSGLGASAAMGVAIARTLLELFGRPDEPELVLRAAGAWERVFHGTPSGIDAAAAYAGGCVRFTREAGASALAVRTPFELVVGKAAPPASTRAMVEAVAKLRVDEPELFETAMQSIAKLVERGISALEAGDIATLGALFDRNQLELQRLGVSHPEIERALEVARRAGALGAKLTGAGGGGCAIALVTNAQAVLDAWAAIGIEGFCARVGGPGSSRTGRAH